MEEPQTRSFVFQDEKSSKFWEITQTSGSVTVRYGKTGTIGQSQLKEFADEAASSKHVQKLIAEKLGKGYEERVVVVSDSSASVVYATTAKNEDPAIKTQIEECCILRDRILQYLVQYPELGEERAYALTPATTIMDRLHYLENSFELDQKECALDHIDRTSSMFSGPLYCSEKYPQARDDAGNPMFPILQIDLRWINDHCQKSLPEGVLQLWIDTKWSKHVLRVVPLSEVTLDQAVPFDWGTLHQISNKRTKERSATWPCDPEPHQLVGVIPVGMSCPEISGSLDHSEHEIPDELVSTIKELESSMHAYGTHLFGKFYDPQQDPANFLPYKLFLTLVGWGSEGYAHIHYLTEENGNTLFKFSHCAR